jgi:hypothetical protein
MKPQAVIQAIVSAHSAHANSINVDNSHWAQEWQAYLDAILELLPSGSGFDNGTTLESASPTRVEFATSFHHMSDGGYYDGWTEHRVIVSAEFDGFAIRVTGQNKRDIREYIVDVFHAALSAEAPEPSWRTPSHA